MSHASAHGAIGHHGGTRRATLIQSRQSNRHDACTSHVKWSGLTGVHKSLRSSFSFFLLLSSVAVAPLAILEFSPPYEVCGALNRLQELISRSYWVRMPSLPSHLVIFQKFRLDELMW
jgi:hypothetical protein